MPHPIGTVICQPHAQFAFPRSYIKAWDIFTNNTNPATYSDGLITLTSPSFPLFREYIKIKDELLPWSSNRYTLGWMIEYWYYTFDLGVTETPYGGIVKFSWDDTRKQFTIRISTDVPDTHVLVDLDPPTLPYWADGYLGA